MDLPGTGYHFAGCLLCCIVSGAYFGDEMSPLSDTTNLAPAIAGSTLFDHIRHMVWTTGPSLMGGVILGVICMAFQGIVNPKAYMLTLNYGFVSENVNPDLVELLSGGGMQNMMWTISLIMLRHGLRRYRGLHRRHGLLRRRADEGRKGNQRRSGLHDHLLLHLCQCRLL